MALNLGRWFKYAQAKLDHAVRQDHAELDRLEAEREAEQADRPWLGDDGEVPTFDQVKARIDGEAARQRDVAEHAPTGHGAAGTPAPPSAPDAPPAAAVGPPDPIEQANADPDAAAARIELDRRAREADERLAAIRAELGVEPPAEPDQT